MRRIRRYYILQFGADANRRQSLSDERDKIFAFMWSPIVRRFVHNLSGNVFCSVAVWKSKSFAAPNYVHKQHNVRACTRTDESARQRFINSIPFTSLL